MGKYIVKIEIRRKGVWGWFLSLFEAAWYRVITTEDYLPEIQSKIMKVIDKLY